MASGNYFIILLSSEDPITSPNILQAKQVLSKKMSEMYKKKRENKAIADL